MAAAIGSPLAGRLSDRIGYRLVYTGAVAIVVVCFVVAAVVTSLLPFVVVYAAYGIGFATATSMLYTLLATGLPSEVRSPVLNLALVPLYVSGVIGSVIATQALVWTNNDLRPLWLLGAVFMAVALVPLLAGRVERVPSGRWHRSGLSCSSRPTARTRTAPRPSCAPCWPPSVFPSISSGCRSTTWTRPPASASTARPRSGSTAGTSCRHRRARRSAWRAGSTRDPAASLMAFHPKR